MPTYFQRPENALKRANEFMDVEKPQRALDALCDVIKSKKHRTWQKIHEPIMEKYLELCVSLKKSHVAKEGLHQYKNICQQINVASLEKVVRRYLQLAEEKTEEASKLSHQTVLDIDDLECPETPESLLLSAVSAEDTQDRTDRAILTPWVKFLWESYRQCLDLLRNNSSYEKLYQDIAQQAFSFCIKYERKTEFRKLCESLRLHLQHIQKHHNQQRAINLSNPESQALHLETRLVQLDSAIKMELWAEALKAVEDVHGLVALSKKSPKPSLMANYYNKVALVFWKSGSYLFHAAAWHALYRLSRDQRKNLSQEELQRLASRVLVATLAIPVVPQNSPLAHVLDVEDTTIEKQRRLATLLGLNAPPTRFSLIAELLKGQAVQHAHPLLQPLYRNLEVEFNPLTLSDRVKPAIDYCKEQDQLSAYIEPLNVVTVTRLITQVAQVYETISLSRFCQLAKFTSPQQLEQITVNVAKNLEIPLRIDHRSKSITFTADSTFSSCRRFGDDITLGPVLQALPGEQLRSQLINMANVLQKAVSSIDKSENTNTLMIQIVNEYKKSAKMEHEKILSRKIQIENRKVKQEEEQSARQQEVYERQEQERLKQVEIEKERLNKERKERELKKRQEEHDEIRKKEAKNRIEMLKQTDIGRKVFENMNEDEISQLDPDMIMNRQVEQLEKEKRELLERLKAQEKKVDFFERAKRLEEITLLNEFSERMTAESKRYWDEQEKLRIDELRRERVVALQHRDRLKRMTLDKDNWINDLKKERYSIYKEKLSAWEKEVENERNKKLLLRHEERKRNRREAYYKELEAKKQQEEEERAKDEEQKKLAAQKREEEEKMEKLKQMAIKQAKRTLEIEEKMKGNESLRSERPQINKPVEKWAPKSSHDKWRTKELHKDNLWRSESNVKKDDDFDSKWRNESNVKKDVDNDNSKWRSETNVKKDAEFDNNKPWRPREINSDRHRGKEDNYLNRNVDSGENKSWRDHPPKDSDRKELKPKRENVENKSWR